MSAARRAERWGNSLGRRVVNRAKHVARIQPTELLRERLQMVEERHQLALARNGRGVCWLENDDETEPLVTVRIATYNRGPILAERAIASALRQTYQRLEILIVGDSCDEPTERAVRRANDPRIRFLNLPQRGRYPDDPLKRWMVAGTVPMNLALTLARGAWIAPCDDDDELTDNHVELLLQHARKHRLEFVHSKAEWEERPGEWRTVGSPRLKRGHVAHGAVLYSLGLRFIRHSETSWRRDEPADWNMWRRMRALGVRIGYVNAVTYRHYVEAHRR